MCADASPLPVQVRARYGRPLRAIVIRASGVLPIRAPFVWQG